MVIEVSQRAPEPRKIRRAAEAVRAGKVIAYPTDTCYGLGCDLFNKKAIDRLCRIKRISRAHPLSFVCRNIADIARYAMLHDYEYRIVKRFLPGPYCFVLNASKEVPKGVQSARKQVGVRVPDHPTARAIVEELGGPIISSTAVLPGGLPEVDPLEIDAKFSGLELVLDGGPGGTLPTTVVDLSGDHPTIIREGAGPVAPFQL